MGKVVGFGDMLVRLSPPGYQRFLQAASFDVNYTGAEANVLVGLSNNGIDTEFVTRLPDNAISACAVSMLKRFSVGTSHIAYSGNRLGVFYCEKGASQRPSKIVYDRKYTAISEAKPTDFNWDNIFQGADWFHFTGITPALGEHLPQVVEEACQKAHAAGITISCDLNYRSALWSEEKAQSVMKNLMQYVDILIGNEEDACKVLGAVPGNTDVNSGKLDYSGYVSIAEQLINTYHFKKVAFSLRESISASDNNWSAMLFSDGKCFQSKKYSIHLIDRVGGGDSFAAGLIYGLMKAFDPQTVIEYATAAACLKQTMEMDFNLSTEDEIFRLMGGDSSGRIQR